MYATSNRLRALITFGRLDEADAVLARHQEVSARGRYAAFQFVGWAFEVVLELAAAASSRPRPPPSTPMPSAAADHTPFDAGVYGLQMFALRREQGRLGEVAPVLELVAPRQVDQPLWRPGLAALYSDLDMLDAAGESSRRSPPTASPRCRVTRCGPRAPPSSPRSASASATWSGPPCSTTSSPPTQGGT